MGVNSPMFLALLSRSLKAARSTSVINACGLMSSIVIACLTNGGGLVGKGCVGQLCSPGISLFGTGRSSIGHIGSPVTRSKT